MIDEVNASANVQEITLAVDTQTNSCLSIQHDKSIYVCDIEMGADVQVSSSDEDYHTVDSQEMQPDSGFNDHDLPATPMVSYSSVVKSLMMK